MNQNTTGYDSPFGGPPPSSVELTGRMPTGEDELGLAFRTDEERHRMAEIRRGVHHRLVAHRAVEEARRAEVLMWAGLLLCVPAFLLGAYVAVLGMHLLASGEVRERYTNLAIGACVGLASAVWTEGALFALAVSKKLVNLAVERFGKAMWE